MTDWIPLLVFAGCALLFLAGWCAHALLGKPKQIERWITRDQVRDERGRFQKVTQ